MQSGVKLAHDTRWCRSIEAPTYYHLIQVQVFGLEPDATNRQSDTPLLGQPYTLRLNTFERCCESKVALVSVFGNGQECTRRGDLEQRDKGRRERGLTDGLVRSASKA